MIKNIKYAYYSLSRKVSYTILSIIQLSICFIFVYFLINNILYTYTQMYNMETILGNNNIYRIKFYDEIELEKSKSDSEGLKQFYSEFSHQFKENVSFCQKIIPNIQSFDGVESFMTPGAPNDREFKAVRALTIDYDFILQFPFHITEGRNFKLNDFNLSPNDIIPVILGYEYAKHFKVGDKFNYENPYGGNIKTVEVIGFLENNAIFIDDIESISLDNYIIFPLEPVKSTIYLTEGEDEYNNMLNFLQLLPLRETLIRTDKESTNIDSIKKYISNNNSSHLLYLEDLSNSYENLISSYKTYFSAQVTDIIFIIIFISIGLIYNSLKNIKNNYLEYGIHISYGAPIKSIFYRIILEFIIISTISFFISSTFIIYFNILNNYDMIYCLTSLAILILFAMVISIVISIPSIFKLKKTKVIAFIRR